MKPVAPTLLALAVTAAPTAAQPADLTPADDLVTENVPKIPGEPEPLGEHDAEVFRVGQLDPLEPDVLRPVQLEQGLPEGSGAGEGVGNEPIAVIPFLR